MIFIFESRVIKQEYMNFSTLSNFKRMYIYNNKFFELICFKYFLEEYHDFRNELRGHDFSVGYTL